MTRTPRNSKIDFEASADANMLHGRFGNILTPGGDLLHFVTRLSYKGTVTTRRVIGTRHCSSRAGRAKSKKEYRIHSAQKDCSSPLKEERGQEGKVKEKKCP